MSTAKERVRQTVARINTSVEQAAPQPSTAKERVARTVNALNAVRAAQKVNTPEVQVAQPEMPQSRQSSGASGITAKPVQSLAEGVRERAYDRAIAANESKPKAAQSLAEAVRDRHVPATTPKSKYGTVKTAEQLRREHEIYITLRDQAKAEAARYAKVAGDLGLVNAWATPDDPQRDVLANAQKNAEKAQKNYEHYQDMVGQTAAQYYHRENQEQQDKLRADGQSALLYRSVTEKKSDIDKAVAVADYAINGAAAQDPAQIDEYKKHLFDTYGLTEEAIRDYAIRGADRSTPEGGYTNIYQLIDQLEREVTDEAKKLEDSGFKYRRMSGYQQMLKDKAEYEKKRAQWEQAAKDDPILASIGTVAVAPLQGLDAVGSWISGIGQSDEENIDSYVPANVYNMDAVNAVQTVRGTVSKEIEQNTNWELFGHNVASFLYQTGMSVADSATQVYALGPAATYVMGMSSAANQSHDIIERGGTNRQAFWGGLAAGAAECIFEKVSIDNLLKPKEITGWKSLFKETMKQAGVEASEEMATEIANILSDAAIMGERSEFNSAVKQYMTGKDRLTEEAAKKKAFLDCVGQVVWAGAGGAISGGVMGGAQGLFTRSQMAKAEAKASYTDPLIADIRAKGQGQADTGVIPTQAGATIPSAQNAVEGAKTASTGKIAKPGEYRLSQPQNVNMPTVPIITMSVNDIPGRTSPMLTAGNSLRTSAINRARRRLGLDKNSAAYIPASNVMRDGNEYVLKITKTSLTKMLSPTDGGAVPLESIVVMDNLERIANNGVWFDGQGDRKGRTQIAGFDHLKTTVYIDSVPYEVDMRVRLVEETPGKGADNVLYYFTPEEILTIEKVGTEPPTYGRRASVSRSEAMPTFNDSIPQTTQDVNPNGGNMPNGVGAAEAGFAGGYDQLQRSTSQFHPDGESRARQVDVPAHDFGGRNIPKSAATVMEAQATPDNVVGMIQDAIAAGTFSFDAVTDAGAVNRARAEVEENGWEQALGAWHQDVQRGKVSKDMVAKGQLLLNNAMNAQGITEQRRGELVVQILTDYTAMSTTSAQALQAQRILKKLSPEWKLFACRKSLDAYQAELRRTMGDKAPDITVDPELYVAYLEAEGEEAQNEALKAIYQSVADQVPATWREKWNAWRYLSMLANPRTHIRNIVGNAGFMPVRMIKNAIASGVEAAVDPIVRSIRNHGIERTKAILTLGDAGLLRAAWADVTNVQDQLLGEGKYSLSPRGQIDQMRTIFKLKPLESVRTFNGAALDVEDTWFSRPAYAESLAQYLKANGVTAEMMADGSVDTETMDAARTYAIKEAQKATYRDSNAFSDLVAKIRVPGNNKASRTANVLIEGILPFKRTPANILVRGVEYSPAGLVKGLTYDLAQVAKGKKTAAAAIDSISAGLTGTGLLAMGAWLASMGLVSGGDDEYKERGNLHDLTGGQNYALNLPNGYSVTLDWLAPEAMPFFVGVEMFNYMVDHGEDKIDLNAVENAVLRVTDPLLEQSMLQGLQDAIETVKFSDDGVLERMIANAALGYLTQGIPTLFGQIERTAEGERYTTFVDRESGIPKSVQTLLGKTLNKLPGEYNQIPYIDAWGRREETGDPILRAINNLANPAYVSKQTETEADAEIRRLLDAGQSGVAPKRPSQSDTIGGEYLTAEEYVAYAEAKGKRSYELVSALIGSSRYKNLKDADKAAAIKKAYEYAKETAKATVKPQYEVPTWVENVKTSTQDLGISQAEWLCYYEKYGTKLMSGDAYEKTKRMVKAGLGLDEWATMRGAVGTDCTKAELTAYIEAHFDRERWHDLFAAYAGAGESAWKNPY